MHKIEIPYTFKSEELELIRRYHRSHQDWENQNFTNLKDEIRNYLRKQQNNKCCYCKSELGFDLKDVDIEHIIPKSEYNQFTFHSLNLALSCPACNTIKGETDVLKKKIKRYPKNSRGLKIIHAHYDDYYENILIHENSVYEALSVKGSHTITVCQLFRLKKVMEKAKKQIIKSNSGMSELTTKVLSANNDEIQEILNAIAKRIS